MNIYIDESGSMTHEIYSIKNNFFIIALVLTEQPNELRKVYKKFISKNLATLKSIDNDNKMFIDNEFVELKGSALTPKIKRDFVHYFCQNNHFKLAYIIIDNSKTNINFYKNKARAFNYTLKLMLNHLNNRKILKDRNWVLQIDERNVKTDTKYELQSLLLTEFLTGKNIVDDVCVTYFDSCNNKLIQLADVFANIMYSNLVTVGKYNEEIKFMLDSQYLLKPFIFPLT